MSQIQPWDILFLLANSGNLYERCFEKFGVHSQNSMTVPIFW